MGACSQVKLKTELKTEYWRVAERLVERFWVPQYAGFACACSESRSQRPRRQPARPAGTTRVTRLTRLPRTSVLLRVFPIVTFLPHLLCNSPRLNDLASRSKGYLISKRFLLTTAPFCASIACEIGAPTRFARRSRTPLLALPLLFQTSRLSQAPGSAHLCFGGSGGMSPRHPLPTTHHPLSSIYL